MNNTPILTELIEAEFPQSDDIIYLNHAGVGPWPKRTTDAIQAFADENLKFGATHYPAWVETEHELRDNLKTLINAPSVDDIALLKNTSEALSVVAYGIDWQQGDNIVTSNEEFPSNRIVWESLHDQGVELLEADLSSQATPEDSLFALVDNKTRMITISAVQFASGLRVDLERIGQFCKEHDILFCVDAIQYIGAFPIDVQAIQADFVMADGHKWMLGPEGVALLYVHPDKREQLKLHQFGWHMVEHAQDFSIRDWKPANSARRFECGSPNMLGVHGLNASISLLLEVGMENIARIIIKNTLYLIDKVKYNDNIELVSSTNPNQLSGIVILRHKQHDSEELYKQLMKSGVICAPRGGGIRFSPHFYITTDKLDRVLDLMS